MIDGNREISVFFHLCEMKYHRLTFFSSASLASLVRHRDNRELKNDFESKNNIAPICWRRTRVRGAGPCAPKKLKQN